jgi:DNA-binding IclR family transcriptional regulator
VAAEVEDQAVRSVLRAMDLLGLFTEQRGTWTVRELTEASGLAKTTVIRLVATLEQRGMLWSGSDGQVTVGPGLLRWARLARSAWELPEPVREVIKQLSTQCGETVNLYVRSNTVRICVAQQEGPQNIRHVVRVGDEFPLAVGATGKILLTGAPDAVFDAITDDPEALREQVRAAAHDGYSVSHGERELGASGVAAPILDSDGNVLAALALGGPTSRFTPERVADFVAAVTSAAQWISRIGIQR